MNFKVIEGDYDSFMKIKEDLEKDYLFSDIPVESLRLKYNLSRKQFTTITRVIKSENGLNRRPRKTNYFYNNGKGYILLKKMNGTVKYGGFIPYCKEKLLVKAVLICESLKWDSDKCKSAIKELKECN